MPLVFESADIERAIALGGVQPKGVSVHKGEEGERRAASIRVVNQAQQLEAGGDPVVDRNNEAVHRETGLLLGVSQPDAEGVPGGGAGLDTAVRDVHGGRAVPAEEEVQGVGGAAEGVRQAVEADPLDDRLGSACVPSLLPLLAGEPRGGAGVLQGGLEGQVAFGERPGVAAVQPAGERGHHRG